VKTARTPGSRQVLNQLVYLYINMMVITRLIVFKK
jgi:hypothetical protein